MGAFVEITEDYFHDNSRLLTGHVEAWADPYYFSHDPDYGISLYENNEYNKIIFREFLLKFTHEIIYFLLTEHFLSLPAYLENGFYKLGYQAINHCSGNDQKTWDEVCQMALRHSDGLIIKNSRVNKATYEKIPFRSQDVLTFYRELLSNFRYEMRDILPFNEWCIVNIDLTRQHMALTFGEDLRIKVFEDQYGKGRWVGDMYES